MRYMACAVATLTTLPSCDVLTTLPVETEVAIVNLSRRWYAVIELRPADKPGAPETEFVRTKRIPPWAVYRERFATLFPETGGCPDRLDLRVYLYKRINEETLVGLDPDEAVDPRAITSAEIHVAACGRVVASTFTIVLLESVEGVGAIQVGEGTEAEDLVVFDGRNLSDLEAVPPRMDSAALSGHVLRPDGTSLKHVGVLLRAPPTVDDPVRCPATPVGECVGEVIAFTTTDDEGHFMFDRPAGTYQVEPFADDLAFRPGYVVVESPLDNILFFGEAIP